jgi:hypothetical protein
LGPEGYLRQPFQDIQAYLLDIHGWDTADTGCHEIELYQFINSSL